MQNIILFDKLIFTEIFPLENHGMEDKKGFSTLQGRCQGQGDVPNISDVSI